MCEHSLTVHHTINVVTSLFFIICLRQHDEDEKLSFSISKSRFFFGTWTIDLISLAYYGLGFSSNTSVHWPKLNDVMHLCRISNLLSKKNLTIAFISCVCLNSRNVSVELI